jgi:hypothetical protein
MKLFFPFADDNLHKQTIKEITKAVKNHLHWTPSFWYQKISFHKEEKLLQAIVGERMNARDGYGNGLIIAIVSTTNGPILIWTDERGLDEWPPIMINPSTIAESELFDFPGMCDTKSYKSNGAK